VTNAQTGGTPIFSYSLEVDDGNGGEFRALYGNATNSMSTSYILAEPDMRGKVYRSRYRVRNAVGWSGYSPITQKRAASKPEAPTTAPKLVAATATTISITLTKSDDNGGSIITSHELYIDDGALGLYQQVTRYNGADLTFTIDQA